MTSWARGIAVRGSGVVSSAEPRGSDAARLLPQQQSGSTKRGGTPLSRSVTFAVSLACFFQAEDGIRYYKVTGVQTCALPISTKGAAQNLLAKVYLTRAYREWNTANLQPDFQQALDLANTVINSGQYSLVPDFARLWCGTHRAAAPADPGGQSFCDLTNYSERNTEFIFVTQYSYDPTQYQSGQTNYDHLEFLSNYDANPAWAVGLVRDLDNGRPFRRLRPTPALLDFFAQTRWAGTPGPGTDVLDTRFDGSFQTVWFANGAAANPTGTCPTCTSGAPISGTLLRDAGGGGIGAAAGADIAV